MMKLERIALAGWVLLGISMLATQARAASIEGLFFHMDRPWTESAGGLLYVDGELCGNFWGPAEPFHCEVGAGEHVVFLVPPFSRQMLGHNICAPGESGDCHMAGQTMSLRDGNHLAVTVPEEDGFVEIWWAQGDNDAWEEATKGKCITR